MSVQSQTQAVVKTMTNNVFSAIQLFGFDINHNEKQYKINLNSQTFSKPNPKAFEVIVHFLLTQLDGERAQKVFCQCWPPILIEQTKEFKDIMYNWLVELTSSKQQKEINKFHNMLCLIKFPNMTKSLLMSPGGLKICELLFALSQYVILLRLLKLVENEKDKRILPKVSPFTTPFSSVLSTNSHELNKQSSSSSAQIFTQKQLSKFEIQRNSLKHRVDFEISEFDYLLSNFIDVRSQWQQFFQEKTNNIRVLIEKKAQDSQALIRKKAKLASQLNLDKECSIEEICSKFNNSKLTNFENEWFKLMKIKKDSIEDNSKRQEIERLTNGETENLELNGNIFIHGTKKSQTNESNDDINKRILQYVFENIDQNAALRNTKVGDLFQENGTKLDLVNLIRIYSLVLILKGAKYSKIDQAKLTNLTNLVNNGITNKKKSNCSINESASDIKAKLDAYLPKLEEKCGNLLNKKYKEILSKENTVLCDHFQMRRLSVKDYCEAYKKKLDKKLLKSKEYKTFDYNEIALKEKLVIEIDQRNEKFDFTYESEETNKNCVSYTSNGSQNNEKANSSGGKSFGVLDLSEESDMELI